MNKHINKIALIVPNFKWIKVDSNTLWHYIPYNLCLIAAVIEHLYEVVIIDANFSNYSAEALKQKIAEIKPDVVGVTAMMDYYGNAAHVAAKLVKEVDPEIITVIGGVYATTNAEDVINDRNIDYLIAGEGEFVFRDLLLYLQGMNTIIPKGVWYIEGNKKIYGGRSDLITDLDTIPLPAYHLIEFKEYCMNVERNSVDRPSILPYARIFSSRGCPQHCSFCQVETIAGSGFRSRSAENVINEIRWLKNEYGIKSIIIDDDNFFTDRKRARKILYDLIPLKLEWKAIAVAAFMLDDELMELMKESGCKYIDIAVESGCERVLKDIIQKPVKLEKVIQVVNKAKELDIFVAANFILGFPGETWDEIRETLRFAELLDADYIKIFSATPLPKTKLYETAVATNSILEGYDPHNIDWRYAWLQTKEFSAKDLTIMRAYEWDRINFTDGRKRKRIADIMNITEDELYQIRRRTLDNIIWINQ